MNQVMSAALSVDVELYHFLLHVHADFDQNFKYQFFFQSINSFVLINDNLSVNERKSNMVIPTHSCTKCYNLPFKF